MPDLTSPCEGPTCAKNILPCMKYRCRHHTVDQVRNTAAKFEELNGVIRRKQTAFALKHQADELMCELQAFSKFKAKTLLRDYAKIVKAAKGIMEDSVKLLARASFDKTRPEKRMWGRSSNCTRNNQQMK